MHRREEGGEGRRRWPTSHGRGGSRRLLREGEERREKKP
jgi:hypothetical protein